MNKIKEIYIFDIDGVLTDINTHKIEEKYLLDFIVDILNKNQPIAFNTGRPLIWVREELLNTIENEIKDISLLKNLFIAVEKGGEWLQFDKNGIEKVSKDNSIIVPPKLINELHKLVNEKYPNELFYDETKETMITIQKGHDISIDEFNKILPVLYKKITIILKAHDPGKKFKLVPTTLDIDIESVGVGKDFAMGKILKWINNMQLKPEEFITLGDSISDLDMAIHLNKQGHQVRFVYVGEKEINEKDYNFPIIITLEKYDKGTLEYLQANKRL